MGVLWGGADGGDVGWLGGGGDGDEGAAPSELKARGADHVDESAAGQKSIDSAAAAAAAAWKHAAAQLRRREQRLIHVSPPNGPLSSMSIDCIDRGVCSGPSIWVASVAPKCVCG